MQYEWRQGQYCRLGASVRYTQHSFVQNEWHIFTVSIWYFGIDLKWFQFQPKILNPIEPNHPLLSAAILRANARTIHFRWTGIFFSVIHFCCITLNFNHVDIQRPILLASMTESSVRFYTRLHMREKIIPINT